MLETAQLALRGMTCEHCVMTVEKALHDVKGVRRATVDLATQSAVVEFDASASDRAALERAVTAAGYEVGPRKASNGLVVLGGSPADPSAAPGEGPPAVEHPDASEEWLAIEGMSCASCVRSVESAALELPGVIECDVNLAESSARVVRDPIRTSRADLIQAIRGAGYGARPHAGPATGAGSNREDRDLRRRLAVSASLTVPLLVLAMSHGLLDFPGSKWAQLALALPVVAYGGAPFYMAGLRSAFHLRADMNTLIAIGTGSAFAYSLVATAFPGWASASGPAPVYFETAAAILTLVLLGRLLESRARRRAAGSIRKLVALQSREVRVRRGGREVEVPLDGVRPGDIVIIRPGERVPVDGTVIEGSGAVDESPITGESVPVDKRPGTKVVSGSLSRDGHLVFRAERVGSETALSRIIAFVRRAQGSKAPAARLADRIASVFVPVILAVALATFLGWRIFGPPGLGFHTALINAVSVLIIACPCALGLATPAALAVGIGRAAERGILIRDGETLEAARHVDTVVFDKTGTLTRGRFAVTDVDTFGNVPSRELLSAAGSIERLSEHPLAEAIASRSRGPAVEVRKFRALPGAGASAEIGNAQWLIGSRDLMSERGISTVAAEAILSRRAREGKSVVLVARNGALVGSLALRDELRPESRDAVAALRARGVTAVMMSGDNEAASKAVAAQAGIDDVLASVAPTQKAAAIRSLQGAGRAVAMVGDGINDAPGLAQADVGIAIGAGTDIAVESAGIVLVRSDPIDVDRAIELSRRTQRTILQNYFWAFGYNVLGVPIAAGAIYPWTGLLLSPVLASAAMALSSVSVLFNSLRLRRALSA